MSEVRVVFNNENKTDVLAPCSRCGELTDDSPIFRSGRGDLVCRPCSLSGPGFAALMRAAMETLPTSSLMLFDVLRDDSSDNDLLRFLIAGMGDTTLSRELKGFA